MYICVCVKGFGCVYLCAEVESVCVCVCVCSQHPLSCALIFLKTSNIKNNSIFSHERNLKYIKIATTNKHYHKTHKLVNDQHTCIPFPDPPIWLADAPSPWERGRGQSEEPEPKINTQKCRANVNNNNRQHRQHRRAPGDSPLSPQILEPVIRMFSSVSVVTVVTSWEPL